MKRFISRLGSVYYPNRTNLKEQVVLASRFFNTSSNLRNSKVPLSYVHGAYVYSVPLYLKLTVF